MRKSKYNRGDIAQYTNMDGSKELLVITEVFKSMGGLRYAVHWLGTVSYTHLTLPTKRIV